MKPYFHFGEVVAGYDVRVLNEREARAAAGLLFVCAFMSFLYAYRTMDFRYTSIFIIFFLVDFFIRVLVNPKYAPSLIVGRFFVSHQKPEYVGAAQKRFAWSIGLILAIVMFRWVVLLEVMTPLKIYVCLACLILLFSEAAFGICIGCSIYNLFNRTKASHCPGGVCEIRVKEPIQMINWVQAIIAVVALGVAGTALYNNWIQT
ncbi:DUF4395 domain-containing protein [Thiothrix litoralis]|jgi:hypothetical protein|uniref:DUF4395 domain-containing protein n=1 Tax=Thiothrix litoralis TaxID=2891210 RepID=A0ABX7WMU0_9GAMM|nr:DUF4395 domain-containing protein [Thiothrix litoralis]QTR44557.1 DUF4395 domain-containing protein [Thiothrix litoralis]